MGRNAQRRGTPKRVAIGSHRLVLVDLAWLQDAGIERTIRSRRRRLTFTLETLPPRLAVLDADQCAFAEATATLMNIEFRKTGRPRHRRLAAPL